MKYILVNSKAIKKQLLELENVPDEQIKLIYNSVKIKKNIIKIEKEKELKFYVWLIFFHIKIIC